MLIWRSYIEKETLEMKKEHTLRALPIQLKQHNYSNADSSQELWFQRPIPEPLKTKRWKSPL